MGPVEPFSSPIEHKFFASGGSSSVHGGLNFIHPELFRGKRLVVFGCGYVGTAVALEAQAHGLVVTALTRNAASALVLREQGMEAVVADLADAAWHDHVPAAPEFVLNCVSAGGGGLDSYRRSYVEGMESIVRWARDRGSVGTLVYTSSTSVYPQGGGQRIDETAPTTAASERAQVLLAAESILTQSAGVAARWFILRLAGIYGPGRHHLLDQVRTGEIAGLGDHHLNLIQRDDICAAIWASFAAPPDRANAIYNVADDSAATKAEVVAWLASQVGAPSPRFTGQPAGGRRSVTPDRIIASTRIKHELGWSPRYPSYREGFAAVLAGGAG